MKTIQTKFNVNLFIRKSILTISIFILALFFSPTIIVEAGEIYNIDIEVEIFDDGSADFTEIWDVNVDSGTEWYLIHNNLGDMEVSNFSVSDENGKVFETLANWDINKSIEEKAYKAGIVHTQEGHELCWGVGSFGDHKFTVKYHMTNLVKSLDDYDGFNYRFINDELSSGPNSINISIYKDGRDFTPEDTKIWGFGFQGEIWVEDGKIISYSNESLSTRNYVNIMARFDKGIFNPISIENRSFTDMEDIAKEGSQYGPSEEYTSESSGSFISRIGFLIMPFLFFIPTILIGVFAVLNSNKEIKYYKEKFDFKKSDIRDPAYSRDIPFNGSIPKTYWAMTEFSHKPSDGDLLGAYILRWMKSGYLEVIVDQSKKKAKPSLLFRTDSPDIEAEELVLFNMIKRAAGKDGILQERELEKWSNRNYELIERWQDNLLGESLLVLKEEGKVEYIKKDGFFSGGFNAFTREGYIQALGVFGFKKYLEDFTIINERRPVEVELWEEYLVFANLFGIAEEVAKEFRNIYPDYFVGDTGTNNFYTYYYVSRMSRAYTAGASSARSASTSSGGGGFTSSGGGGGFSGGGSGGGSR